MSEAVPSAQRAAGDRAGARRARPHSGRGGTTRVVEGVVLVLAGILLATATINDLVRQTNVNQRLNADLRTWRSYTGHDYRNLNINQDVRRLSTREVVCGNTSPGAPKAHVQLCLQITGPVRGGRRSVSGGWYLPPKVEDVHAYRYACFGPAVEEERCPR